MKSLTTLAVIVTALFTPAIAAAHPGHGVLPGNSLWHWLLEPLHAVAIVCAIALASLVVPRLVSARPRRS